MRAPVKRSVLQPPIEWQFRSSILHAACASRLAPHKKIEIPHTFAPVTTWESVACEQNLNIRDSSYRLIRIEDCHWTEQTIPLQLRQLESAACLPDFHLFSIVVHPENSRTSQKLESAHNCLRVV